MPASRRRRLLFFATAAAALIAGTLAVNLMPGTESGSGGLPRPASPGSAVDAAEPPWRSPANRRSAAAPVVARFARAYLRYEVGRLDARTRSALLGTCAGAFARELLSAPPRLPPGGSEPRERYLRLAVLRPTVLGGVAAFSAQVAVTRDSQRQLLEISLVERDGRWAVIGVGP